MNNEWDYADIYDAIQDMAAEMAEFLSNLTMHETRSADTDFEIQKALTDWRERLSEIEPVIPFTGGRN